MEQSAQLSRVEIAMLAAKVKDQQHQASQFAASQSPVVLHLSEPSDAAIEKHLKLMTILAHQGLEAKDDMGFEAFARFLFDIYAAFDYIGVPSHFDDDGTAHWLITHGARADDDGNITTSHDSPTVESATRTTVRPIFPKNTQPAVSSPLQNVQYVNTAEGFEDHEDHAAKRRKSS